MASFLNSWRSLDILRGPCPKMKRKKKKNKGKETREIGKRKHNTIMIS
jgi:hypothetical protein